MEFERQIVAMLLLVCALFAALFLTLSLWRRRAEPGLSHWMVGLWVLVLGVSFFVLPWIRLERLSILVRNVAILLGTGWLSLGTAQFLERKVWRWAPWAGALICVPFLLHWIPAIPDFTARGGSVGVVLGGWHLWCSYLLLRHGRQHHRGVAWFGGALFAGQGLLHLVRAYYLFFMARPSTLDQAGLIQTLTYSESMVFFVVLALTLWTLTHHKMPKPLPQA